MQGMTREIHTFVDNLEPLLIKSVGFYPFLTKSVTVRLYNILASS
jgi:hypothetical protein